MRQQWIKGACAAVWLTSLASGAAQAQSSPQVHMADGDLVGITQDGINQFRGIPYAQPPVGSLRWTATQPVKGWSGQRDATQFSAACPQVPDPFADTARNSEDCLYLNVYSPVSTDHGARPVILWVPGGGTVLGSARQYDAQKLAQATQTVVVTINYRLGALGWLWTSGMQAEREGGNFALQDQQEAMRWVQRHIASFNGDPHKVTLVGESIGATSVSLHLVSPKAAGLFQRVIMASGIEPPGIFTSDKAAAQGDAFATRLGCPAGADQVACLRNKPIEDILRISPTYADIGRMGIYWKNFIDGTMVTGEVSTALSKGKFNRVPVMVGSTRDEGRGFVPLSFDLDGTAMTQAEYVESVKQFFGSQPQPLLTGLMYPVSKFASPSLAASQVLTDSFACQSYDAASKASAYVPAFAYEFADRTAPEFVHDPFMEEAGAFHASDLLYWFQTPPGGAPLALNPAQTRLSDQMQRYWKNFAETGNPNGANGSADPVWPKFNKLSTPFLTLVPDAIKNQEWGAFQRAHQCGMWSILLTLRASGAV
jgi:para-nitrobenzyl esterase